jgi:hypothetical protein
MSDHYALPRGVSLGQREVHEALAALGIVAYSSVTIARGSVLTHTLLDRARARSLRVVEAETTNQPTVVVGDVALWRRVQTVAYELADSQRQNTGEVTELALAVDEFPCSGHEHEKGTRKSPSSPPYRPVDDHALLRKGRHTD